jgi:hypothetical protein
MDATLDTISMDKCSIAVPLSMLLVTGQKVFHRRGGAGLRSRNEAK